MSSESWICPPGYHPSQPSLTMLFSPVATAPDSANEGVGNKSLTLAAICAVIKRAQIVEFGTFPILANLRDRNACR